MFWIWQQQLYINKCYDKGKRPISDLTTLSGLTQLRQLYLNGNQITDVTPLADLTELEILDLGYNNIADVSPLSGLSAGVDSRLSGNPAAASKCCLGRGRRQLADFARFERVDEKVQIAHAFDKMANLAFVPLKARAVFHGVVKEHFNWNIKSFREFIQRFSGAFFYLGISAANIAHGRIWDAAIFGELVYCRICFSQDFIQTNHLVCHGCAVTNEIRRLSSRVVTLATNLFSYKAA
jgi:hypothetical protein